MGIIKKLIVAKIATKSVKKVMASRQRKSVEGKHAAQGRRETAARLKPSTQR